MTSPDPATERVCRTEVELEQGGWFWRCTTHALGQFGMVSRDDAEFEASEHRRRYAGLP